MEGDLSLVDGSDADVTIRKALKKLSISGEVNTPESTSVPRTANGDKSAP